MPTESKRVGEFLYLFIKWKEKKTYEITMTTTRWWSRRRYHKWNFFIFPLLSQSNAKNKRKLCECAVFNVFGMVTLYWVYHFFWQMKPKRLLSMGPHSMWIHQYNSFESSKLRNSGCDATNWTWIEYLRAHIIFPHSTFISNWTEFIRCCCCVSF